MHQGDETVKQVCQDAYNLYFHNNAFISSYEDGQKQILDELRQMIVEILNGGDEAVLVILVWIMVFFKFEILPRALKILHKGKYKILGNLISTSFLSKNIVKFKNIYGYRTYRINHYHFSGIIKSCDSI